MWARLDIVALVCWCDALMRKTVRVGCSTKYTANRKVGNMDFKVWEGMKEKTEGLTACYGRFRVCTLT